MKHTTTTLFERMSVIARGNPEGVPTIPDRPPVRAISLHQPWASACFHIVDGKAAKGVETRGPNIGNTRYRGPLVIHASKRWGPAERRMLEVAREMVEGLPATVPLGALIGMVQLVDVVPTEEVHPRIGAVERFFGVYDAGRFAWIFAEPRPFATPIPYTGRQSFFSVPAEVLP
jgi:hypothetical protein